MDVPQAVQSIARQIVRVRAMNQNAPRCDTRTLVVVARTLKGPGIAHLSQQYYSLFFHQFDDQLMAEHSGVAQQLLVPLYSVREYESDLQAAFAAGLKSLLLSGNILRQSAIKSVGE